MDHIDNFWLPRPSFRATTPEVQQAADLLDEAADALLVGDLEHARRCVHLADDPAVHAFADSIMGKESVEVHRIRCSGLRPATIKSTSRMPGGAEQAAYFARDGWRCRFCGVRVMLPSARRAMIARLPGAIRWGNRAKDLHAAFFALSATVDHVVPHSAGGLNDASNLVTACWPCNFGRMARTIEEVGLLDPRLRPPLVDGWDGLARLSRLGRDVRPPSATVPRTAANRVPGMEPQDWFGTLDECQQGVSHRLLAFLRNVEQLHVSWSLNKVLIVRIAVREASLSVFGIEASGGVHVPWSIGTHKVAFRNFAISLAAAMPDATAYETPKLWSVRKANRTLISISEILGADQAVTGALRRLRADVMASTSGCQSMPLG